MTDALLPQLVGDLPGWSPWAPTTSETVRQAPWAPGIYVIAAHRPVNRLLGADQLGILDIGETKSLRQRLSQFLRSAGDGRYGHMAGRRFSSLGFATHFPLPTLSVRWCMVPTKGEAHRLEGQLLAEYARCHLEPPPLNYAANWSEPDA